MPQLGTAAPRRRDTIERSETVTSVARCACSFILLQPHNLTHRYRMSSTMTRYLPCLLVSRHLSTPQHSIFFRHRIYLGRQLVVGLLSLAHHDVIPSIEVQSWPYCLAKATVGITVWPKSQ